MLDGDKVRVDLLRVKRKLYISHPEGSKERADFLVASQRAELAYLKELYTPEMITLVYDEYTKQQKSEIINFVLCLTIGLCLSLMLLGFHQSHPTNWLLSLYKMPFLFGFVWALTHLYHSIEHYRTLKPFKDECLSIQNKIDKITDGLKGFGQ